MHPDVNCPYCDAPINICNDDGFGMEEDKLHEYECHACEKTFVFTASFHIYYESFKADCLNGEPHKWEAAKCIPDIYPDRKICRDCGHIEKGRYDPDATRGVI